MKIGILTFHKAYNYGAILQTFALQKKLTEMGYESEIIDYLSKEKKKDIQLFSYKSDESIKYNVVNFIKDIYRVWKNRKFNEFIFKELKLSAASYSTFDEMKVLDDSDTYNVYIVGSDQVWNINNNKNDKTYLLSFVNKYSKKCSYAASIGNAEFNTETHDLYFNELSKFRVLTVREQSSIDKFDFLSLNHAKVCLDPTLLLDKTIYSSIASKRVERNRYAFLYTIEEERNLRNFAKNFCKINHLKLIDSKRSMSFFYHSSPYDFLSFIQNADYVFTNSFHGTAFSVILQKQFVTEVNTKYRLNNRSFDLLSKLGISSRDIDARDFQPKKIIDYDSVQKKINLLRHQSTAVLKEIVRETEI